MGASQSIIAEYTNQNCIYIPTIISNNYVDDFLDNLLKSNVNIINSKLGLHTFTADEINNYLEFILTKSKLIILLVSPQLMELYTKSFEINSIDSHSINNNIIYLMIDENFTPENSTFVNRYVGNNKWYPLYSQENVEKLLTDVNSML